MGARGPTREGRNAAPFCYGAPVTARRLLCLLLVLWGLGHVVEWLVTTLALWAQLDPDLYDGGALDAYMQTLWHRQLARGLVLGIVAAMCVLRGRAVAHALLPPMPQGHQTMRPWVEVGLAFAGLHAVVFTTMTLVGVLLFAHQSDMWEFSLEPIEQPLAPHVIPIVAGLVVMLLPRLGRVLVPLRARSDEASA